MPIRVAFDGLNGVNRQILAATIAGGFSDLFEVVHINEPAGAEAAVRRLRFDSIYGRFPAAVSSADGGLTIGERAITFGEATRTADLDWDELGVDLVVMGTPDHERAAEHLDRNAKKVVIAGSSRVPGKRVIFGLNEGSYDPDRDDVVETGSPHLNAVANIASVIQKSFAIARGSFTVVLPPGDDQPSRDGVTADLLTSRSLVSVVPALADRTSEELGEIDPILGSKLAGSVLHVPASPVGWVNVAVETERRFERDAALDAFRTAAESDQHGGLLGVTEGQYVSRDFVGDARSVVVIENELAMIGRAFVSVRGWFDAEWALACRGVDLIAFVCDAGVPGTA